MINMQAEDTIYSRLQSPRYREAGKNKLINKYSALHREI